MKRRILLFVLFLLALGGLMLHYKIHPFMVAEKFTSAGLFFLPIYFLS